MSHGLALRRRNILWLLLMLGRVGMHSNEFGTLFSAIEEVPLVNYKVYESVI
jgi:hypothetical protein